MSQKSVIPAEKNLEQLIGIIKKDLMWLFASAVAAVAAALAVNMLI